jgi:hypothetical protein
MMEEDLRSVKSMKFSLIVNFQRFFISLKTPPSIFRAVVSRCSRRIHPQLGAMNNSRTDVNGAGEGPLSSLPFQTLQTAAGLLPIPAPAVPHNNGAPATYAGGNAAPQAARPISHAGKARAGGRKLCEAPGCNTTANYGFQGQSKCVC